MSTITTVGVAGAGTMGAGIAIVAARAGFRTIVYDTDAASVERARGQARGFLDKSVERGKMQPGERDAAIRAWSGTTDIAALGEADIVMEAVFEDLAVKHALLEKLDGVCSKEALFASNTSTISITEIAAGSQRPERVVGMHFCLPAQLMKLVEMSPGLRTDDAAFSRAWQFCLDMGQRPVRTKDTPGFVLNYFLIPYNNDAIRLVEQGVATPADIDLAIRTALGYAMGPMQLLDLIGMDTQLRLCEAMHGLTNEPRAACPPLVKRMIAAGHLGKKSGRGFFDYDGDTRAFGA